MLPVEFNKQRAEHFMQCLGEDKPITPKEDWNVADMIILAGVCFAFIRSHGIMLKRIAANMNTSFKIPVTAGHKEADDEESILNDLHAAIEFVSELAWLVHEKEYDALWEESLQCLVYQEGEIHSRHLPVKGFKKGRNLLEEPDCETIKMCAMAIRKDCGTLSDVPRELANTVANVYYRFFRLAGDVGARAKRNPNGWVPPPTEGKDSLKFPIKSFLNNVTSCIVDTDSVKGFVEGLRKIDRERQPQLYEYTVEFILDCLKYNIPRAHRKRLLRRRFERHFRKRNVTEIPNLIERLTPFISAGEEEGRAGVSPQTKN
jgi:hypothetical protein